MFGAVGVTRTFGARRFEAKRGSSASVGMTGLGEARDEE
jgi:hypothetical protein